LLERFKREGTHGGTAVAERPVEHSGNGDRDHMRAIRARQREEFGGVNWGAAFFGWLVAIGLGALLVGLLAAAGAAVGVTNLPKRGAEYNVIERLDLPALPAGDSELASGGALALVLVVFGTLLAARGRYRR
jgi:hypothetical protein